MSESLLFAVLGFLIACLFGTVFASLLWRRAVTVTKRKLGVADSATPDAVDPETLAEMQELRRRLGERDLQVRNLKSDNERQNQDRAVSEAEARDEVKRQLTSAARELEKAATDKAKLEKDLTDVENRLSTVEKDLHTTQNTLSTRNERIQALEDAIRTLVVSTGLPSVESDQPVQDLPNEPETDPAREEPEHPAIEEADIPGHQLTPNSAKDGDDNADIDTAQSDDESEASDTLVAAASQSLDERIQALMQGQKPH